MNGALMIAIECDPERIAMRLKTGYLDRRRRAWTRQQWEQAGRRFPSAYSATQPSCCRSSPSARKARNPGGARHRPDLGA